LGLVMGSSEVVRRHPPHHLSPAEQTTRQGAIPEARLSRSKSPQQRSDQGRKPVISEKIVAGRAKILPSVIMGSNPSLSAISY
jgi:hypothetical protein